VIWSPAPGGRGRPRAPITAATPPTSPIIGAITSPPLVCPPPSWDAVLPVLQVTALHGVLGWAVFLAVTTDPWLAMFVVGLTCALAIKIVTAIRAAGRTAERLVTFDLPPAGHVVLDRDDDGW
jgi:hypothetical protein